MQNTRRDFSAKCRQNVYPTKSINWREFRNAVTETRPHPLTWVSANRRSLFDSRETAKVNKHQQQQQRAPASPAKHWPVSSDDRRRVDCKIFGPLYYTVDCRWLRDAERSLVTFARTRMERPVRPSRSTAQRQQLVIHSQIEATPYYHKRNYDMNFSSLFS